MRTTSALLLCAIVYALDSDWIVQNSDRNLMLIWSGNNEPFSHTCARSCECHIPTTDFSNFPVLFTEEDNDRIMRENVEIEKEMQRWLKESSY